MNSPSLQIVQYPFPTLRYRSKPIKRVDQELKLLIGQMFDAMYDANGIGLAANQVNLPLRVFVINPTGQRGEGDELVFINPVISAPKGSHEGEEGCLSIVGVNASVTRPAQVHVQGFDLQGNEINRTVDGLLAKVIQHEYDHLEGVLFIDRISESARVNIEDQLNDFELIHKSLQVTGELPADEAIIAGLQEHEARYC